MEEHITLFFSIWLTLCSIGGKSDYFGATLSNVDEVLDPRLWVEITLYEYAGLEDITSNS